MTAIAAVAVLLHALAFTPSGLTPSNCAAHHPPVACASDEVLAATLVTGSQRWRTRFWTLSRRAPPPG